MRHAVLADGLQRWVNGAYDTPAEVSDLAVKAPKDWRVELAAALARRGGEPGDQPLVRGNPLPAGSAGEVTIKGPGLTPGYLNNEAANADAFYGVLDEDGYLRLEGRLKEMILRGGENISPYEIEAVLLAHPAVADAICFGIDDEKYGERVGAAVTLVGVAGERALIDYCRERLAAFKVPETVHVLDAIPRTATGKVQRKRIGASLAQSSR